jgi:hypothetical protein
MKYFSLIFWLALFAACPFSTAAQNNITSAIRQSKPYVLLRDGTLATSIKINRTWSGNFCTITLTNTGVNNLNLKEAILFQANHLFKPLSTLKVFKC